MHAFQTNVIEVTWIYAFPTWILELSAVVVFCAVAAGGLLLARMTTRNDLIRHNDVAGPILSLIGTVLAVMLAFLVVVVWQQFDASAARVEKEAASAVDLYRLARFLPPSLGTPIRNDVRTYLSEGIVLEWPAMQHGSNAPQLSLVTTDLLKRLATANAREQAQQNLLHAAFTDTTAIIDARRERLHDNESGLPPILWGVMVVLSLITVTFTYYLNVANPRAHALMVVALTATITIMFVLIAELDYPFRGDTSVSPAAFQHALEQLDNINMF